MMKGLLWTPEETVVAVVLNMWGMDCGEIARLLTNKITELRGIQTSTIDGTPVALQYKRTEHAVKGKLSRIRAERPELCSEEGSLWDENAVYALMSSTLEGDFFTYLTPNDRPELLKLPNINHVFTKKN
ncbi:hypothetical protein RU639_013504 [Aspergillus parasiticus]